MGSEPAAARPVGTAGRAVARAGDRPTEHQPPRRVGGLLAVYVVALGILIVHGLGLTVAAVIVNANPSLAGLDEPLGWGHIAFYAATNAILIAYTAVVMRAILAHRRSAIVHNAALAVLTVVVLVIWHLLGMKSLIGVVVDSAPGLVGIVYLARSERVAQTLTHQTA